MNRWLFIPLSMVILSFPVLAAQKQGEPGGGYNLVYFLFVSLIVICVAYFATQWIGKYAKGLGNNRGRLIKIAESVYLGPNRGLHLVLVGNKIYLVGQGEQGMNLLTELDDEELIQQVKAAGENNSGAVMNGFGQYLQTFLARDARTPLVPVGSADQLREQLNRVRHRKERGE